jgi:DNA-binding NarL/FixJ family response regulator
MADGTGVVDEPATDDEGTEHGDLLTTVALLHPDASRRALLERKLERAPEIELVLSAGDTDEVLTSVIEQLPDVVAVFPGENLVELVARLEHEAPAVSVLVLDPGPEHFPALSAGARGTLPSGGSEITKAVLGISTDETVLTPEWAELLLKAIAAIDERVRRLALLTETEREVLQRRAEGETPRAIADLYEVSERLVNLHMGFAVGKYHRATEAVRALDVFEAVRAAADVEDPGEAGSAPDDR